MIIRKIGSTAEEEELQGPDGTKVGPGTPYPDYEVVPTGPPVDIFKQPGTGVLDRILQGLPGRTAKLVTGAQTPEGALDYGLMAAGSYPVIAGAGAGAAALGLPGVLGRIGGAGALGGAQSAMQGQSPVSGALTDAAIAAGAEGLGGLLTSGVKMGPVKLGLKEWGAPAREFERAKVLPEAAAEAIRPQVYRLLSRHLDMPSMPGGTTTGVTLADAAKWVASQRRENYQAALKELTHALNKASLPGRKAGEALSARVSPSLFEPPAGAAAAERARQMFTTGQVQSIVDSLMTASPAEGMPMGELLGAAVLPNLRVPYMSHGRRYPAGGGY